MDVVIEGDPEAQQGIRYNIFQLCQESPSFQRVWVIPEGGQAPLGLPFLLFLLFLRRFGLGAVSYTHLDVYKRQGGADRLERLCWVHLKARDKVKVVGLDQGQKGVQQLGVQPQVLCQHPKPLRTK